MRSCKICTMSDQRPGIVFNEEGICSACEKFEELKKVDWNLRWLDLMMLCNKHRNTLTEYDCLIGVSGGKDSHYQVGTFKEKLGMHPLCFMVDNISWTQTGRDNFYNLSEQFDVDIINFTSRRKTMIEKTRQGFIEQCWPSKYWDEVLYIKPMEIARKFGIRLVIWGENPALQRGGLWKDTPNAKQMSGSKDLFPEIDFIFMSYYVPWNRWTNVDYSLKHGFKTLEKEWVRLGLETFFYQQIDTVGYLVNNYCKFIKFGFGTVTELCCDSVRNGKMTRKEAIDMINENDWKIDPLMVEDFCNGLGITEDYFWEVIDKFANKKLLKKEGKYWKLKKKAI